MSIPKILVCFDTDPQPSVFDGVVAVDAGVDHLFRHCGVKPDAVRDLVYGAMFTRAPGDLKNTAVFIGGSDVDAGEELLAAAKACFFGPMRVSLMLDSNGANTTAAAAVLTAAKHVPLEGTPVTVLGATGSVGRRVARLLGRAGAKVRVASRQMSRAKQVCESCGKMPAPATFEPCETRNEDSIRAAVAGAVVVVAAGAPGIELLPERIRTQSDQLKVAIDLNAVPPAGIGGIGSQDKAKDVGGQICYGAIGVGGLKMKLHKAAIRKLFESNDAVLDAEEIYALGAEI
jgi:hypothetical protein